MKRAYIIFMDEEDGREKCGDILQIEYEGIFHAGEFKGVPTGVFTFTDTQGVTTYETRVH